MTKYREILERKLREMKLNSAAEVYTKGVGEGSVKGLSQK